MINLHQAGNMTPVEKPWDDLCVSVKRATAKRYHDRTLGDDGTSYYEAIFDIYRAGFSKGTDWWTGKTYRTKVIGNKSASGTEILEELCRGRDRKPDTWSCIHLRIRFFRSAETRKRSDWMSFTAAVRSHVILRWKMSGKSDVLLQDLMLERKKVSSSVQVTDMIMRWNHTEEQHLMHSKMQDMMWSQSVKIFDIFDGEGLTESNKSKSSVHGMEQTIEISKKEISKACAL